MLNKECRKRTAKIVPFVRSHTAGGKQRLLLVDAMTETQVTEMYHMICSASQRGQGFGVDEYENEAEFRAEVEDGFRFAVMDKDGGEMIAAFILAISKYSRGCLVADPFIIVRDDQRGNGLGKLCMELAVDLAPSLGYLGMYVDTFSNNKAMIRIIESIPGLQKVGSLPMGGLMTDGEVVGTVIYYKDLRADNHQNNG